MIESSDCLYSEPTRASQATADHACPPANLPPATAELPTRQRNALRHLLDQATVTPADVAHLSYRTLERAPGVGKQSVEIIVAWLRANGLVLAGQPTLTHNPRVLQRQRKLERAISLLRANGYEVRHDE